MNQTLKIVNLDHYNTLPGGVGQPHDRAVVLDMTRTEKHIITGEEQPLCVYRGDLRGAHVFIAAKENR